MVVKDQILFFSANIAYYLLVVIEVMLFLRAIMSWFLNEEESGFMFVLVGLTEPILIPFRALLSRSERMQSIPIDFSLTFAMITVILVQTLLDLLV